MISLHRYLGITVHPDDTPGKLFSKFHIVCDTARRALRRERRDPFRDPYRLAVYLLKPGKYKTLEEASFLVKSKGEKRPLTVRELLSLNFYDPTIRGRYPIFAGDFVLEYDIHDREEGDTRIQDRKWKLGPSSFHRGIVIDRDSVFAMTDLTAVDKGSLCLDRFDSNTQEANAILLQAGIPFETPRLMA